MTYQEKVKSITDRWDVRLTSFEPQKEYEIFREGKLYLDVFHKYFKIKNGKQLYITVCKIVHLNPHLEEVDALDIARFIANSANGISSSSFSDEFVEGITYKAYADVKNEEIEIEYQTRKVFFNTNCRLSTESRKRMSSKLSSKSRRVDFHHLWDAIEELKQNDMIIDNLRLSMLCNCSKKTISRRMTKAMKREISFHNKKMRVKYSRRH